MALFYNIAGSIIVLLAILLLKLRTKFDSTDKEFRSATTVLFITYLLVAISMFAAQTEPRIENHQFQILNAGMLAFFYVIANGFIYTMIILYRWQWAGQYFKRTLPVFALFILYILLLPIVPDSEIYSIKQLISLLRTDVMVVLRCLIFAAVCLSVLDGIRIIGQASRQYSNQFLASATAENFERNMIISKFMWSISALSSWTLLTYLYTTPTLEIVSCSLITAVLGIQLYALNHYATKVKDNSIENKTDDCLNQPESEIKSRIENWATRSDKPFTQSSLTIVEVAREIGIPKNRLSSYINCSQGNFRSWINSLRIEQAQYLIETRNDLSISQIADLTGFCDLAAFSHAFKRINGISPKSYRSHCVSKS